MNHKLEKDIKNYLIYHTINTINIAEHYNRIAYNYGKPIAAEESDRIIAMLLNPQLPNIQALLRDKYANSM